MVVETAGDKTRIGDKSKRTRGRAELGGVGGRRSLRSGSSRRVGGRRSLRSGSLRRRVGGGRSLRNGSLRRRVGV